MRTNDDENPDNVKNKLYEDLENIISDVPRKDKMIINSVLMHESAYTKLHGQT